MAGMYENWIKITWCVAQHVPMHPTMEPASEMMVPMAENIVIARNIPSMAEIWSHVSTGKITDLLTKGRHSHLLIFNN